MDISRISGAELTRTINFINRNVQLVRLLTHWRDLRASLTANGKEVREVIAYYGLVSQGGRTHISMAKEKLCESTHGRRGTLTLGRQAFHGGSEPTPSEKLS